MFLLTHCENVKRIVRKYVVHLFGLSVATLEGGGGGGGGRRADMKNCPTSES